MLADFYRSKEWEKLREILMLERAEENGDIICVHCGKPIVKKYDCIGHHLIELTETNYHDFNISLNPDNIVFVHHTCHNEIHDKTGYKQPKVYIVWGSPLSGKTSYVKRVAKYGDLILDIDSLWAAVSGRPRYEKPNRIKDNVFALRDLMLQQIKMRTGFWQRAYIIGGYALPIERERLAERLGAELIYIDSTKEECLARLDRATDKRKKSDWQRYINEWWATFDRFKHIPPGP